MSFKQNFDGIDPDSREKTSRDLVPEGIHFATVEKIKETKTQTPNRYPMVKIMVRCTGSGSAHGMTQWDNIVFCESMKGRNKHLLKVLEQPCEGEDLEIDPPKWIGQELRVKIVHENYKGKPVSKISQYLYKDDTKKKDDEDVQGNEEKGEEEIPPEARNEIPF